MNRTVLLRTRCGCEKYMIVTSPRREINVPLRPNFTDFLVKREPPVIEECIKVRRFLIDGCTADGIYIYTEEEAK